ncbi:MAG TPA: ABC transporter ATP-binding protein [Acidimicrobiia bacterium]|nr:ABC transporter ATP-binding protein [Acidimicrobiia bacterium]
MSDPVIRCRNVIKIHKQGALEVVALQGIDFEAHAGEFVAIVGRSGSGKSSLLQIMGGMDQPSAGKVEVAGMDLTSPFGADILTHFRRNVGFLWQDFTRNLVPYLKAIQNVELPMLLAGVGGARRRARAKALLEVTDLRNQTFARVNVLSGGEQQRLALCVALSLGPKLLLADEPTGELDTERSLQVYDLLRRLCNEGGLTVVAVTHDVALASRADRVLHMQDGVFRVDRRGRFRRPVDLGRDGRLTLPPELIGEAMLGDRVIAEVVEEGILLNRDPGNA